MIAQVLLDRAAVGFGHVVKQALMRKVKRMPGAKWQAESRDRAVFRRRSPSSSMRPFSMFRP